MKNPTVDINKFLKLSNDPIYTAEDETSVAFCSGCGCVALLLDKNDLTAHDIIENIRNNAANGFRESSQLCEYLRRMCNADNLEFIFDTGVRLPVGKTTAALLCNADNTSCKYQNVRFMAVFKSMQAFSVSDKTATIYEHLGIHGVIAPINPNAVDENVLRNFACAAKRLA